jgi:glucose/arabinose dehydrogenase
MKQFLYFFPPLILLLFLSFSACSDDSVSIIDIEDPDDNGDEPTDIAISVPGGFVVDVFAEGIDLPTSIEFPPDGSDRLFVNELQTGKIWIYENGERLSGPFVDLALNIEGGFPVAGENGLLGLEFDPDYETNGYVYVTYAARNGDSEIATVARFTDVNNRGEDFTELLTDLPSDKGHQIQNLRFGPDGMLYVSVGDAYEEHKVQDMNEYHGKILRMTPEGEIPADNPFGDDSYIYALGFRNAYDMQFRENGDLLATDNGPSGMDRFLVIEAGGNYGWPDEEGFNENPDFTNPIHVWVNTTAPTGMHIYRGDQFPSEYHGQLFQVLFGFTASTTPNENGKRVQVVDISGEGQDIEVTFEDFAVWEFNDGFPNNPVDITEGPDGSLYVTDIFQGKIFRISYQP